MDRRITDRRMSAANDIYVFDVYALVHILWRRKALLMGILAVLVAPALLYVALKPDKYRAMTSVIIDNQQINSADFQEAIPAGRFDDLTIETQVKVISSPTLIHKTLDAITGKTIDANATEESKAERYKDLKTFIKNLTVTPVGKSRVIEISYISSDPYNSARFVNTHAQNYIAYQIANKKEQVAAINSWLSEQIAALRKESQVKSQTVQEYRKEAGIVLGKNSQDLIYQQITDLTEQLVPVETQKLMLQSRYDALSATDEKAALGEPNTPYLQELKAAASAARQELKSLGAQYGPNHPAIRAAKKKVDQVESDLARERSKTRDSIALELDAATKQESLLRARLEELNGQADTLRQKQIALESLEAEEAANRKLLDSFLERYEQLKSQLGYNRADAHIVSPAEMPTEPMGTPKSILALVLTILAIMVSTGAVLLLELVDRGVEGPEDVRKTLNLRLVGSLPKVKNPLGEAANKNRPHYYDEIKRVCLALAIKKTPQIVLFTAASFGEGVSTNVIAVARYLASIQRRVIVIDANTKNPAIAELAQINPMPGLAEIVSGGIDYTKAIHKSDRGMAIIPAGNLGSYNVDLLSSGRFENLLMTLKSQYDFILIDASPIGSTTDAEIIAGIADQSILVVEGRKTSKKALKKATISLRQYTKETPSVILNKQA